MTDPAPCTLCGQPTRLPIDKAHGLGVRHIACQRRFMAEFGEGPVNEKARQIIDGGADRLTG